MMILKGQDAFHIVHGNRFSEDGFQGQTFDYLLANPPFGVEWEKVKDPIRREHEKLGFDDRFGPDCPASTTAASCSSSTWSPK